MTLELRSYNDYADLTKKYLRNYHTFKLTEKMLEEDIRSKEQILSASLDVGAAVARYGDAPAGGHTELNGIEAACERHLRMRQDIQNMKSDLSELRRLTDKIDIAFNVADDIARSMVRDYYMDGYSWEQISMKHHYSARWCREKVKKAVEDMSMVIFGMKAKPLQLSFVFVQ